MKKTLSLVLALVMCLSMALPMTAVAEEPHKVSVFLHVCKEEWSNDILFKTVMDKFNLEFEWIPCPYDALSTTLSSLYAANELPDFFICIQGCASTFYRGLVEEELVHDLTPFIESGKYPNLEAYLATPTFDREMINGKWYGIPRYYENVYPAGMWYRADWLEELNLPIPTTVEEFAETLKAVVAAKGVQGVSLYDAFAPDWMVTFTGTNGWHEYEDTGRVQQFYVRPEYRAYLSWMNKMFEDGILDPDIQTGAYEYQAEKFAAGNTFACWFNIDANIINPYYDTLLAVDPNAKLGILPPLTGPAGQIAAAGGDFFDGSMGISSKVPVETVEAILAMCDYLVSPEGREMAEYGLEGVHYTVEDGKKVRIEAGFEADIANCSNIWGLGVHRVNQLIEGYFSRGVRPTVQRYDLLAPAYQANYDAKPSETANVAAFTSDNLVNFESSVGDAVSLARMEFMTGVRDIDNDADWEAYLAELEMAGYNAIEDDLNAWYAAQ